MMVDAGGTRTCVYPHVSRPLYHCAMDADVSALCVIWLPGDDEDDGELGFLGCMRNLEIGSESIDEIQGDQNYGVINGSCGIQDK